MRDPQGPRGPGQGGWRLAPRLGVWLGLGLLLGPSLAACPGGSGAAAPGVLTGTLRYGGNPAPLRRVRLGNDESRAPVITDERGRFTFTGLNQAGAFVVYRGRGDREGVQANEVAEWRSLPADVGARGVELPPIEVGYNGLLYPEQNAVLLLGPETPVPFHWSVHAQGERYRVRLTTEQAVVWSSDQVGEPTTYLAQKLPAGRYFWQVEIDGGAAGQGISPARTVDF